MLASAVFRMILSRWMAMLRFAGRGPARWGTPGGTPEQVAAGGVERVHDVAGAGEEHHALVHDRGGLLRARLHRPRPGQLELPDVVAVDLIQRAVPPSVAGPPPVQPALGRRIGQQRVGDGARGRRLDGRRLGSGSLGGRRRGDGENAQRGKGNDSKRGENGERGDTVHPGIPFRLSARAIRGTNPWDKRAAPALPGGPAPAAVDDYGSDSARCHQTLPKLTNGPPSTDIRMRTW